MKIRERNADDIIANLHEEVRRLEDGIRRIGEFLNENPPRVGDASWTVEALLVR
jgi:hypothetical protein